MQYMSIASFLWHHTVYYVVPNLLNVPGLLHKYCGLLVEYAMPVSFLEIYRYLFSRAKPSVALISNTEES